MCGHVYTIKSKMCVSFMLCFMNLCIDSIPRSDPVARSFLHGPTDRPTDRPTAFVLVSLPPLVGQDTIAQGNTPKPLCPDDC